MNQRIEFHKKSFRLLWIPVILIWTLFSNAVTIRDNFMSLEWQRRLETLSLLPKWHWYVWVIGVLVILLVGVLEGSYRAARPSELDDTRAIVGGADLLIQRLDLGDLRIIEQGSAYAINLGVFIRVSVVVTDKPRTVSGFLAELHSNGAMYSAEAEREIGDYYHRYNRDISDGYGNIIVQDMHEEMNNLLALVRTTPIAPATQAEGWLHFEFQKVRGGHEPQHGGTFRLYAFDALKHRYELDTTNMQVREVASHEYAELKRH
jgi:hypothetical protein